MNSYFKLLENNGIVMINSLQMTNWRYCYSYFENLQVHQLLSPLFNSINLCN